VVNLDEFFGRADRRGDSRIARNSNMSFRRNMKIKRHREKFGDE
jgi:hypothetical protein